MEASPVSAAVAPIRIGCCARPVEGAHKPKPRQRPTSQRSLMLNIFETFPDRLNSETEFLRAMRHHMSVLPTFRLECTSWRYRPRGLTQRNGAIDIPQWSRRVVTIEHNAATCALRTRIEIVPTDGTKAANLVSGDFGRPPFWAPLR